MDSSAHSLAQYIDHTLLHPTASDKQIHLLCKQALEHQFASVCISPIWVPLAQQHLRNSNIKVCTVAGFPQGTSTSETKSFEASQAVLDGADEIDMVIQLAALKRGDYQTVREDILGVVSAGKPVKVILECGLLSDAEKRAGSQCAIDAGAAFVKTSTGYGPSGATIHDVTLLRNTVGPTFGVKAAGGLRTASDVRAMIDAGASRIGTSASLAIVGVIADNKDVKDP